MGYFVELASVALSTLVYVIIIALLLSRQSAARTVGLPKIRMIFQANARAISELANSVLYNPGTRQLPNLIKNTSIAACFGCCVLASFNLNAASYSAYTGVWNQHYSGDVVDRDGRTDVQSQLGIQGNANYEAGVVWHGQDGWTPNIRFGVFEMNASGKSTQSESVTTTFLGIPTGSTTGSADIRSEIDYLVWSSNFFYDVPWRGILFEVGGVINYVDGAVEADVDYDESAEATGNVDERRRNSTKSIIPTAYGSMSAQFNNWVGVGINLYGASAGSDRVRQYSISLVAKPTQKLRLTGGYRSQKIDFVDEDEGTGLDITIAGLFGRVSYQF